MLTRIGYIFLFSLLFLTACVKNEFKLNFNLKEDVTQNYNVIYYANDSKGGLTMQAVASVREGKCVLDGITKLPTLLYITGRKSNYPLVVYAERGQQISVTGDDSQPLSWEVEGNEINETLSEWRLENIKSLDLENIESVNSAVKKFVEDNPDNPASLILMQCYYTRYKNEREYSFLMSSLDKKLQNSKWFRLIGRADYLYPQNNLPAQLRRLVMRSEHPEGDTLAIDNKNPVFLFFWQTGDSDNNEITDSIKKLIKDYQSANRLIGDVCLDLDSTAWRTALRNDSLEDLKRFWAPTGLADPTVAKFKVNSIPFFIVFDKEGRQTYRGRELSEAMKEYRHLTN